jgi:hypothetical protein
MLSKTAQRTLDALTAGYALSTYGPDPLAYQNVIERAPGYFAQHGAPHYEFGVPGGVMRLLIKQGYIQEDRRVTYAYRIRGIYPTPDTTSPVEVIHWRRVVAA